MLPLELVCAIVQLCDPGTARNLALVSREVCRWSIHARWRCVVVASEDALVGLWETLGRGKGISVPEKVGELVTELFVDTGVDLERVERRQAQREKEAREAAEALPGCTPWEQVQAVKLRPTHDRLSSLLSRFPNIESLSLGAVEMQLFAPSLHSVAPIRLSLVYDGNEAGLSDALLAGTSELLFRAPDGELRLGGLRRRLRQLTVVGVDPRSPLPGVPFPVGILEPLRRGSTAPGSLLHAARFASPPTANEEGVQGITHLRYDTKKFSFRPAEIFAARLLPFVAQLEGHLGLEALALNWVAAPNAPPQQEQDQGGWPAEKRDAWTGNPDDFKHELLECINTLYGWTRRDQQRMHGEMVPRIVGMDASVFSAASRYVPRPPGEFIRLGGRAALTKAERLELFLSSVEAV